MFATGSVSCCRDWQGLHARYLEIVAVLANNVFPDVTDRTCDFVFSDTHCFFKGIWTNIVITPYYQNIKPNGWISQSDESLSILQLMMTSSNGNIFRVAGHLCGKFTGHRWIPSTKASYAEIWCFLWSAPLPSRPLWRHCNATPNPASATLLCVCLWTWIKPSQ